MPLQDFTEPTFKIDLNRLSESPGVFERFLIEYPLRDAVRELSKRSAFRKVTYPESLHEVFQSSLDEIVPVQDSITQLIDVIDQDVALRQFHRLMTTYLSQEERAILLEHLEGADFQAIALRRGMTVDAVKEISRQAFEVARTFTQHPTLGPRLLTLFGSNP